MTGSIAIKEESKCAKINNKLTILDFLYNDINTRGNYDPVKFHKVIQQISKLAEELQSESESN